MSLLAVKAYFENVGKAQGLVQLTDPFGEDEIAATKAAKSFHIFIDQTTGSRRQNQAYDLDSRVVFTIYQRSERDVNAGLNNTINRVEALLIACMNEFSENGVTVVTFDSVDYRALSQTKNDNLIKARLVFNVRHILCLE